MADIMPFKKPRVYLAGPDLFYSNAEARYARLREICHQNRLEPVVPTDGQPTSLSATRDSARRLYVHDLNLLNSCVGVLGNITPFQGLDPDAGTAYELGYAAARGLIVATYCLDGKTTRERVQAQGRTIGEDGRDRFGVLVEDFGLPANLMLCAGHAFFDRAEAAAEYLALALRWRRALPSPEEMVQSPA